MGLRVRALECGNAADALGGRSTVSERRETGMEKRFLNEPKYGGTYIHRIKWNAFDRRKEMVESQQLSDIVAERFLRC